MSDPLDLKPNGFGYYTEGQAVAITGLSVWELRGARLYGQLDFPLDASGRPHEDDKGYPIGSEFGAAFIFPSWNIYEAPATRRRAAAEAAASPRQD